MQDRISQLESAIGGAARDGRITEQALLELASAAGVDLLMAQRAACRAGIWPARYVRNARQLSLQEQLALLESHVLLVGLGGLGGWLLELLARLGVGVITGVDADRFEESNLNRQLLGHANNLGQSKAEAAAARVAAVNPATHFTPVACFADETLAARLLRGKNLVLDALGGLDGRLPLQKAAAHAGVPLISAGIAGLTGWVAVVLPGQAGPVPRLGAGPSESATTPEEELGNLAPTAVMAASLQAAEALKLLTGRPPTPDMLLFDLADGELQRIRL